MFRFGEAAAPPPDPKEQLREWTRGIKKEMRGIDRQMRAIEREEAKLKREIKAAAKRGQNGAIKSMAKELVRSKKAKERMTTSKAQLNSVCLQLSQQNAMVKVAGAFAKSTEVMTTMASLLKAPEVAATMRKMAMEMEKAGVIEEMMDDAIEATEDADLDDEADAEVEAVMFELTAGAFGTVSSVPTHGMKKPAAAAAAPAPAAAAAVPAGGGGDDLGDLSSRFDDL
jgi:charged multivesicular body protein 3